MGYNLAAESHIRATIGLRAGRIRNRAQSKRWERLQLLDYSNHGTFSQSKELESAAGVYSSAHHHKSAMTGCYPISDLPIVFHVEDRQVGVLARLD